MIIMFQIGYNHTKILNVKCAFVFTLFLSLPGLAVVTNLKTTKPLNSCVVRLSNAPIGKELQFSGEQYFCVGNLISPNQIVTASHCLNQVFNSKEFDIKQPPKNLSTHISYGNQVRSETATIDKNSGSISVPIEMDEADERKAFIKSGLLEKVKSDYAIIRIEKNITDVRLGNCPQLPSEEDCKAFSEYLKFPHREMNRLFGDFYRSGVVKVGQGANAKAITYPSGDVVSVVRVETIDNSTQYGYLSLTVQNKETRFAFVVGDSGSGLIWKNGERNLIVGVQSAASADGGTRALFSQICSQFDQFNEVR